MTDSVNNENGNKTSVVDDTQKENREINKCQDQSKESISSKNFYLQYLRSGIEYCGEHPFATGLFALTGLAGLVLSVVGFQLDRNEAASSTNQALKIQEMVSTISMATKEKPITSSLLSKLAPDGKQGKSIRYVEEALGAPNEEYENSRVFHNDGLRLEFKGIRDNQYSSFTLGPLPEAKIEGLEPLSMKVGWRFPENIDINFRELRIGDFKDKFSSCHVSDWGNGQSPCHNFLEIECETDRDLFISTGIDLCYHNPSQVLGQNYLFESDNYIATYEESRVFLDKKKVQELKVNFISVSTTKKQCRRGEGC